MEMNLLLSEKECRLIGSHWLHLWLLEALAGCTHLSALCCCMSWHASSSFSIIISISTHFSLKIIKSHFVIAKSLTFCAAFERTKFFVVPRPFVLTGDTFEWQLWRFDLPVSFRKLFNFRCSTLWNPRELFPHILGEFYSPF